MGKQSTSPVSATRLAGIMICEEQTRLREIHGNRLSPTQRVAVKRGEREHVRHHRKVMELSDRRCFVATCVFGEDAWETNQLRAFRDRVLNPHTSGRVLVGLYYRCSPAIIPCLERIRIFKALIRTLLRLFVAMVRDPHE